MRLCKPNEKPTPALQAHSQPPHTTGPFFLPQNQPFFPHIVCRAVFFHLSKIDIFTCSVCEMYSVRWYVEKKLAAGKNFSSLTPTGRGAGKNTVPALSEFVEHSPLLRGVALRGFSFFSPKRRGVLTLSRLAGRLIFFTLERMRSIENLASDSSSPCRMLIAHCSLLIV